MSSKRFKKGDMVVAIAGVDAGKTGKVLQVVPQRNRAIVEGMNVVKKAMRKTQDNPQGGIGSRESSIHLSNLMPYCSECKTGVRVKRQKEGETLARKCGRCGKALD